MKRLIAIVLTLVLALSLAACSSDKGESTAVESTEISEVSQPDENVNSMEDLYAPFREQIESQAEESNAALGESSKLSVKNDYDSFYLNWKYANWESASEADKAKCINAYMGYLGDLMGMVVTEEDRSEEQTSRLYSSLMNTLKNNPDFTVKEIILYTLAAEESEEE